MEGRGPRGDFPDSVPGGSCSLSFQEPALRGCGPGWRPDGWNSAALLCLCGARSRSRLPAPHPASRVSRLLPECGLLHPVPVSTVSVLLGLQDGNLAVHSLTCSLSPLVGSGCDSPVISLPLRHWAFNLPTSFQLSFCPLSWDLCSLLASLCLSVPDFDLCI